LLAYLEITDALRGTITPPLRAADTLRHDTPSHMLMIALFRHFHMIFTSFSFRRDFLSLRCLFIIAFAIAISFFFRCHCRHYVISLSSLAFAFTALFFADELRCH